MFPRVKDECREGELDEIMQVSTTPFQEYQRGCRLQMQLYQATVNSCKSPDEERTTGLTLWLTLQIGRAHV